MNARSRTVLTLFAVLLAATGCAPPSASRSAAPARPAASAGEDPAARGAAEGVAVFLTERLALNAEQREKARRYALALIHRNAQIAGMARGGRRVLENLRQSQSRFDAEILSMLTQDQGPRYLRLKSDLYQQTAMRRSPLAPGSPPRSVPTPPGPAVTP